MDTSIKTISILDTPIKTISILDTPDINTTSNLDTSIKTISVLDSVLNMDSTYTILDTNTMLVTNKNIPVKHKQKMYIKSITELIKIPKNKCIKYIYKHKLNKIIWGILLDIILFDNYTLLIFKKGSYTWKHIINFSNYIYFYMH